MMTQVTDSARSQLQAVIAAMARRNRDHAALFAHAASVLLASRAEIEEEATPIAGFSELPISEIVLHGYRLFFRTEEGALWLTGVWRGPNIG